MGKKIIKYHSELFNKEVTLTVDPELNKVKDTVPPPRKVIEAREKIMRLQHLLPK